jgi:hypothetical protein
MRVIARAARTMAMAMRWWVMKRAVASIIYNINMCITVIIYQCAQWRKTYILRWFATTHAIASA